MREIQGRVVLDTAQEMIANTSVALLLVDVLNDFYEPQGEYGRSGIRPHAATAESRTVARSARRRARGGTSGLSHPEHSSREWGQRFAAVSPLQGIGSVRTGRLPASRARGVGEFVSGFEPLPGELVVRKHRPSAFVSTDLEQLLRVAGVGTVLVAGCVTEGCVQSTSVDAMFRDFYTVLVEDCVATFRESLHDDAIRYLERRIAISSSGVVREVLGSLGSG